MAPNLNFPAATSTIALALLHLSRQELDRFITSVNSFHPAPTYTWEISETSIAFLDIKVQSMATAYLPVCTTNLQIPTVICCIHPLILPTSKTSSRSLNFLDFDVYLVMTPISPTNQRKCAISSRSVAILILLSTRLNTVLNSNRQSALQTSQKENNERIPFTLSYHPHNLAAKNIILKNFKLLQNDNETGRIFSQPPLISFKHDKNIGNFLVRHLNLMINRVLLNARANDAM